MMYWAKTNDVMFAVILIAAILILLLWNESANRFAYFQLSDRMRTTKATLRSKGLTLSQVGGNSRRPAVRQFLLLGEGIEIKLYPSKMLEILNGIMSDQMSLMDLQMMTAVQFSD